jgi:hypothetical protein
MTQTPRPATDTNTKWTRYKIACTGCHRTERPAGDGLVDGLCGACRESAAEAAADDDAAAHLQTFPTAALTAAARGELDLNQLARLELANRGLDRAGKWVGFPEARRQAEQLPAFNAAGKRIFVTIPTNEDE